MTPDWLGEVGRRQPSVHLVIASLVCMDQCVGTLRKEGEI